MYFSGHVLLQQATVLENNQPEMGHQSKTTKRVTKFNKHHYESRQKKLWRSVPCCHNSWKVSTFMINVYMSWNRFGATFNFTYFYLVLFFHLSLYILFDIVSLRTSINPIKSMMTFPFSWRLQEWTTGSGSKVKWIVKPPGTETGRTQRQKRHLTITFTWDNTASIARPSLFEAL